MLFLVKRRWQTGLFALALLAGAGLSLRQWLGDVPELQFSLPILILGVAAFAGVLCGDVLLHGLFVLAFGEAYRRRHRELVGLFRGQTAAALVVGAAVAGVGEELVFRGLGTGPVYLVGGAVVFGLLHHVKRSLWPFTAWAVWQGLLFAALVYFGRALAAAMVAHFLHDFAGFGLFRYLNRRQALV